MSIKQEANRNSSLPPRCNSATRRPRNSAKTSCARKTIDRAMSRKLRISPNFISLQPLSPNYAKLQFVAFRAELNLRKATPNGAIPHFSAAIRAEPHHSAHIFSFEPVRLVFRFGARGLPSPSHFYSYLHLKCTNRDLNHSTAAIRGYSR
jgi:hypothetical protein